MVWNKFLFMVIALTIAATMSVDLSIMMTVPVPRWDWASSRESKSILHNMIGTVELSMVWSLTKLLHIWASGVVLGWSRNAHLLFDDAWVVGMIIDAEKHCSLVTVPPKPTRRILCLLLQKLHIPMALSQLQCSSHNWSSPDLLLICFISDYSASHIPLPVSDLVSVTSTMAGSRKRAPSTPKRTPKRPRTTKGKQREQPGGALEMSFQLDASGI